MNNENLAASGGRMAVSNNNENDKDRFWTSADNDAAIAATEAMNNAIAIAEKEGTLRPLAEILERQGVNDAAAAAQWIVDSHRREARHRRLLPNWTPHPDGEFDSESDLDDDEREVAQRERFFNAIRDLPVDQARKLFDIVLEVASKPPKGKPGRRNKWPEYRLRELACDVLESKGETMKARYQNVIENHPQKYKMVGAKAIETQYLRAKKLFGIEEIK